MNSPSARNYSPRSALYEVLHLYDSQSDWTLAEGRGCRIHEAGDSRHQRIAEIGETTAHFAIHTWPTRHGHWIMRVDGSEKPLLRLEHTPHYHLMIAARLM